ncbi:hypothetical protein LCGC14_1261940 [marine sediment metagenome]|uniref:Uncharacterized protein n=1 Tax=marine sediment metagenome TaxID=412755 RepID=A0A0F9P3R1_9ZZZZ
MNENVQPLPPPNPLLERARIPGETFPLPSRGLFYKDGELDASVKNGELLVQPMAAIDELTLKTPDKLFSGQAIEDIFRRCIPQVLKPLELLAQDVDYLLVCLRKLSFGENMEIEYQHDCSESKVHKYVFSVDPFIKNAKQIDPTKIKTSFALTLDNGQTVLMSPPRFMSTLNLYQSSARPDDQIDIQQLNKDLTNMFLGVIQDVDGTTDRDHIAQWLNTIPVGYVHKIQEAIEKASDWGPEFEVTTKCNDCGEDMVIASPINPIAFFM